jgi:hypothetical protein
MDESSWGEHSAAVRNAVPPYYQLQSTPKTGQEFWREGKDFGKSLGGERGDGWKEEGGRKEECWWAEVRL